MPTPPARSLPLEIAIARAEASFIRAAPAGSPPGRLARHPPPATAKAVLRFATALAGPAARVRACGVLRASRPWRHVTGGQPPVREPCDGVSHARSGEPLVKLCFFGTKPLS